MTRPPGRTLTFEPPGIRTAGIARPNDHRSTRPSRHAPVTVRSRPDFISVRTQACAVVCRGVEPRFHVTVPTVAARSDAFDHGPRPTTRWRLVTLAGAFHASKHARSEGRVAAEAAVDSSIRATASPASDGRQRLIALMVSRRDMVSRCRMEPYLDRSHSRAVLPSFPLSLWRNWSSSGTKGVSLRETPGGSGADAAAQTAEDPPIRR